MKVAAVFALLAEVGYARGVRDLVKIPGCSTLVVDERWTLHVNPHRHACLDPEGLEVPGITASVYYNGWPAGLVSPGGGRLVAGEKANEEALLLALREALRLAKGGA